MSTRTRPRRKNPRTGLYYPNLVPLSAIRRYARQIAERFHPDKIILFGSYAYGNPTADSDVDLLVVMRTNNQIEQAVRIDEALEERGFFLDLMVRTPTTLERRLRWGDSFLKEVMTCGRVLYEKTDERVDRKSREPLPKRFADPIHGSRIRSVFFVSKRSKNTSRRYYKRPNLTYQEPMISQS